MQKEESKKLINAVACGLFNETRREKALKPSITFSSGELEINLPDQIKSLSLKEKSILTHVCKNLSKVFTLEEETLKAATIIGGAFFVRGFKNLHDRIPKDPWIYEKEHKEWRERFGSNDMPSILITKS